MRQYLHLMQDATRSALPEIVESYERQKRPVLGLVAIGLMKAPLILFMGLAAYWTHGP